jgi:branched-chain amino acid transport system permease protein
VRRAAVQFIAPVFLVLVAALLGQAATTATQVYFIEALVSVVIVVGLYVFIGNTGVVSFGHISFVALGAWTAGVLTVPVAEKPATMSNLAGLLQHATVGNLASLALAAVAGGVFALLVGLPLMRLSGLAAGIATFAVLEITNNVLQYYEKIGPGQNTFSAVPETTGVWQAAIGALIAVGVAFTYQRSRFGRMMRAGREDPAAASAAGISIYRQRLGAFVLSGLVAGFAGGLEVHLLPLSYRDVYLDLTFVTLAMLVIGGTSSLWGAVVGALAISALDSFLASAENGITILGGTLDLPSGTRVIVEGVLMAAILIVRPNGIDEGGRRRRGNDREPVRGAPRARRRRGRPDAPRRARARAERARAPRLRPVELHRPRRRLHRPGRAG